MRFLLSTLIALLLAGGAVAQNAQTFTALKFRLNHHGQFTESATASPTRLTFDGVNARIDFETESSDMQAFLDYNSTFTIVRADGTGNRKTFVTNEGFIFQVEPMARRILIYRTGGNIRMNALWLDEIEF